jgi:hypothetical protein
MRQRRRIVRHVREDEPLLVVVLAEDLVLAEVEAIADAEPATENVKMILQTGGKTVRKIRFRIDLMLS